MTRGDGRREGEEEAEGEGGEGEEILASERVGALPKVEQEVFADLKTNQIENVSTEGDIIHDWTRFRGSEYLVWLVITQLIGSPSIDRSVICFFLSHIALREVSSTIFQSL